MFFIILLGAFATSAVFAQSNPKVVGKSSDISDAFNDFAAANAGRMNSTAGIGLNWSEAYIGELISYPPHYGFGFTLGMNSMKSSVFKDLIVNTLGMPAVDTLFADKHFFSAYTIEMRLGGFRDYPFDIGFKVGWLPGLPLFFGDFKYSNLQAGFDFRYNILSLWTGFKISWGLGFNYLNGYIELDSYNQKWDGTPEFDPKGAKTRLVWDMINFNAQLIFQKSWRMLGITFFGGIIAGYGIGHTGIAFISENMTLGGNRIYDNPAQYSTYEDQMAGKIAGSTWVIDKLSGIDSDFALTGKVSSNAIDFHTYEGISFDFQTDWHVQIGVLLDLANFEYGFMLGVRWQQQQY